MFDKKKGQKSSEPESPAYDVIQDTPVTSVSTTPVSKTDAMIGSTITIKGDISGNENLLIEGQVEGTINLSNKDLTIGRSGRVQANVTAKEIKIEGEVQGDISGNEKVVISKTGKVQGNIIAPRVTLEDGANFKGRIDMNPAEQASTQPPLKTVKTQDKIQQGKADQEKSEPIVAAKIG